MARIGTEAELDFRTTLAGSHDEAISLKFGITGSHLDKILVTLLKVFEHHSKIGPRPLSFGMALLNRARQALVSSMALARGGAIDDALVLIRVALETSAVAVHVVKQPDALDQFHSPPARNYETSAAIRFSKPFVPFLPLVWGRLSNNAVHTNAARFGPEVRSPTQYSIQMVPIRPTEEKLLGTLATIELAGALVLQCTESCFLEPDPEQDGWLRIPGSRAMVTRSQPHRVEKLYKEYMSSSST